MKLKIVNKIVVSVILLSILLMIQNFNNVKASEATETVSSLKEYALDEPTPFKGENKLMMYDAETNTTSEVDIKESLLSSIKTKSAGKGIVLNPDTNLIKEKRLLLRSGSQQKIYDTSQYPYKAICQLTFNGGSGTGTLIDDNVIITAAHCVFNESSNQKYENWIAHAGRIGNVEYASTGWSKVYYSSAWMSSHSQEYDWAVCVLNDSIGTTIGTWMLAMYYPDYNSLKGIDITCVGYPASSGGAYPYYSTGRIENSKVNEFRATAYSEKGYSGGPIYDSQGNVLGVTHGFYSNNDTCGVRINDMFANAILEAINL